MAMGRSSATCAAAVFAKKSAAAQIIDAVASDSLSGGKHQGAALQQSAGLVNGDKTALAEREIAAGDRGGFKNSTNVQGDVVDRPSFSTECE